MGCQLSAPLRSQIQPHWGGLGDPLGLGAHQAYSWPSEPGYYQDGEFGIRIEDIALVVEAQTEVGQWDGVKRVIGVAPSQGWGKLRGVGDTQRHLSVAAPERGGAFSDLRGGVPGAL